MNTSCLSVERNDFGVFLRADFEGVRNEGYRAAQNPAACDVDCPYIATRFITAWREGFR